MIASEESGEEGRERVPSVSRRVRMRHDNAYRDEEISEGKSNVSSYVVLPFLFLRFEPPVVVLATRHRITTIAAFRASIAFETPRRPIPCIIESRSPA